MSRCPNCQDDHVLEINERLLCVEDGLILGNGDLSVSVYQSVDSILWRFGKGDVWDRRIDLSDDPRPLTVEELGHGIEVEKWKCGPYGGAVEALNGTDDEQRMHEVCQGSPPSYKNRPYPCPKPVGELALQLPPDRMHMRIRQRLVIEQARLEIECTWTEGVRLIVEAIVPPTPNVLVIDWRMENWKTETAVGNKPPVWFKLYRWADPSIHAYAARFFGDSRHPGFLRNAQSSATPLDNPRVVGQDGSPAIEQRFSPDPLFADGFAYRLEPYVSAGMIEAVDMEPTGEARLHILPLQDAEKGWLVVHVPATSDPGGVEAEGARVRAALSTDPAHAIAGWRQNTLEHAREFWNKSAVSIDDPFLENLWYETFHVRRCVTRADRIPPGLFLPSTVSDYSHWHGDYHLNYNLQMPFWGDYTANHFDLGDAYFQAMKYLLQMGRLIAREYYHTRGVFIQLFGYPIRALDDCCGIAPMGRMAYMTGWAANQYWWRYLTSLDKDWLCREGYPVIRDCALFYTDFLKRGADGLYHVFPSNQGEDGFTGNPEDYIDAPQVLAHLRYTLRAAIRASEELATDESLRAEWQERLEHLVSLGDTSRLDGVDRLLAESAPPEFAPWPPFEKHKGPRANLLADRSNYLWTWYLGHALWFVMCMVRNGEFEAERDLQLFRDLVERWRHPNGLIWGMALANYGHCGAWTESLSVVAPLQEMLFQSWGGILRFFPAWPKAIRAGFRSLRGEGAFLVSAFCDLGTVQEVEVFSEAGQVCRFVCPWSACHVMDDAGHAMAVVLEFEGICSFTTQAGRRYRILPTNE